MKRAVFASLWLVALLLCWTAPAFADNAVTFQINQVHGSLWGEYTSPYGTDKVGNVACDDIRDTVYLNTNYTYNTVSANSLIATGIGGIWNAGTTPSQFYAAAAYIVLNDIFGKTGLNQEYGSWALWGLVAPSLVISKSAGQIDQTGCEVIFGVGAWSSNACHSTGGTGGLIADAMANGLTAYGAGAFNNFVVYVPKNAAGNGWCTQNDTSCQAQEFWGQAVPDGGSALGYLVLAGVSCFGTMFRKGSRNTRAA